MDDARMQQFVEKMLNDIGAAAVAPLILVGDRLGLYRALAEKGPLTTEALARETGTVERYVREWCAAQAASGYIDYDPETRSFSMRPEQKAVFTDEDSPVLMTGGYYGIGSMIADEPKIRRAFETGEGVGWGDHDESLFCGTAKFFRPSYRTNLLSEWLPSLDGVVAKLERGARVADVGCGHGISTSLLAERFPGSSFVGFDFHPESIESANAEARRAGLGNLEFRVATAKSFPGHDWDLVTLFDCLHDMGDPAGAAGHIRKALKEDGTLMAVEPMAGDRVEENLNPVGRLYYCFSTMVCTPASLSQEVGAALGAQAGEAKLREVLQAGGFTRIRRAAENPFNMVLEARP